MRLYLASGLECHRWAADGVQKKSKQSLLQGKGGGQAKGHVLVVRVAASVRHSNLGKYPGECSNAPDFSSRSFHLRAIQIATE